MRKSLEATGWVCRFLGVWLVATAGILVYAETAPSIGEPDFLTAMLCLVAGAALFSAGCLCGRRTQTGRRPT